MSLSTNVVNLATRVATEIKAVRTLVNGNAADLSSLTTTAKSNLVAAINELDSAIAAIDTTEVINDSATATTSTWSSTKISSSIEAAVNALVDGAPGLLDTLNELAAALGDDENFATSIATSISTAQSTAISTAAQYTDAEILTVNGTINALTTDDVAEGTTNLYFSDARAADAAAALLTGATLTNIAITGNGAGLTITAENGVADSDTDDLAEGTTNLYFTDARAQAAVATDITTAIGVANTYTDGEILALETAIGDTTANYVTTFEAGLL